MKKSSKIKKIIFSLLIAIGLCLVCKYTVNADDRSYKVQNANFDVHFKTDGSAVVTEQWTVGFKGDYTRFYKDIHYTDLAKVEEFIKSIHQLPNQCIQCNKRNICNGGAKCLTYAVTHTFNNIDINYINNKGI